MKTGNTTWQKNYAIAYGAPQWSPVMKTGNTGRHRPPGGGVPEASMEPGHEDREYLAGGQAGDAGRVASMEPGHEDREYLRHRPGDPAGLHASMEPGHEDREYAATWMSTVTASTCLNGARS